MMIRPGLALPALLLAACALEADPALDEATAPAADLLGLRPEQLAVRAVHREPSGRTHTRMVRQHEGLPVIGGDLVVHTDAQGDIYMVTGSARGGDRDHRRAPVGDRGPRPNR